MASVKEVFPKEAFIEASKNQDYATAIQIIDRHGVVVSNCCNVFDLIKTQKNQSSYLINTIFNKLDVTTLSAESFRLICNNPVMLNSLLLLRDSLKNTDQINHRLHREADEVSNEECIMMLSTTGFINRLDLYRVKLRDNHIKLIKLLGFEKAKKYNIFMPCLYEYSTLIRDEKWNGKLIEYSDPNYTPPQCDIPLVLAIQRGRYDYVSKLIDIIDNPKAIKQRDCRRNGQHGSHENGNNILTYSIANNKFRCTEVILSKLGDFCTKIEYGREKLDVFEYCMVVNDIRTLKLFAKTDHKTYSIGLNSIDIFQFISRFDPVRRHSMWTLIREKYIKDRELCGEPLTEDEHFMDKQLTVITDKVENIEITLQSRERRELHDITSH